MGFRVYLVEYNDTKNTNKTWISLKNIRVHFISFAPFVFRIVMQS